MKLTWFGHSAFRIDLDDAVIMIDPFLANPTFTGDHAAAYADTTHVVLTHGHDDHTGSTVEICKATGATLVASFEVCRFVEGHGIDDYSPLNTGGRVDFGPFAVAFVQAWHSSGTVVEGQSVYLGNPNGVVIEAPGEKTLLHMGDTDIFSDMALINEIYAPKIGIVPIGDRFTMGPKLAAMACRRFFAFDTIVPCHYGTFPALHGTAEDFLSEMGDEKDRVLIPERGVATTL
ncbi:metal-dependent hydrolase [Bauldia sp.]|uniref:metal-dependent hydrolase n=1 Tax=Bauldia sp. TaxID=2575872 RepID=UPI003BAAA8BB